MHYRTDGSNAIEARVLRIGDRLRLDSDRRWWTVKAVTEHFAALTRQVEFQRAGTLCYTVLDWRNGVRGPCNLIGQGYGDGSYTEKECARLLAQFEAGDLEVSQRNWVPIRIADDPKPRRRHDPGALMEEPDLYGKPEDGGR